MIQERAMLAAVHISIWTAVKHDCGVSRDVAERNGAPMSAGRYNKQLLRGADKLDELRTLAGQVRQYFYKITLPWTDEGYRLLPANLYFDLTARMREFEAQFEQGVEAFLSVYPQYIEQVRPELNGLFREEDYPKAEKLRRKFGVKLEVLPIPTGNDFRVQMSAEEQARVAREIDSNVRQSLVRGTEDLWSRLRDVVCRARCDLIPREGVAALLTDSVPVVSGEASFKWLQTSPDPSLGMTISLVRQDGTTIDKVFIEP